MKQKGSKKTAKKRRGIYYYFKVWSRIISGGVKRSYFYKTDIFVRAIRTILVIGIQILLLNVLFGKNELYVGWSKSEAYLVIGIWNLLNYLGWSFFSTNLLYLESKVIDGKFDYILLKPISSDWYASFSDFFITNFVTAISGLILIIYYVVVEWSNISLLNIFIGFIAICVALLIWYAIYLFFASFTISNPRNGILSIAKELLGLTKYPIDVFGESMKIVFYTVIPIAFLTTLPANIIIGKSSYRNVLIGFGIGLILLVISKLVWNMNVKKYSSASS
ncbi:MAG TPA: ABC-2 family transporter protein [Candidatus Pacearchaeota archaeon]|nr:ABC-2 family transporter protein [Candidatus Pacearchaeota archaeon]